MIEEYRVIEIEQYDTHSYIHREKMISQKLLMNLSFSNHVILFGLRSMCYFTHLTLHFILWIKGTCGDKFSKIINPKRFFMKMAFHRKSCTIVVNIVAEFELVFKNRKYLFSALQMKRTLSIIVMSLKFRILFLFKKWFEREFLGWNDILFLG